MQWHRCKHCRTRRLTASEPVWPRSKYRRQAGKQKDLLSIPLRLSSLFRNCSLWTLSFWLCPSQWPSVVYGHCPFDFVHHNGQVLFMETVLLTLSFTMAKCGLWTLSFWFCPSQRPIVVYGHCPFDFVHHNGQLWFMDTVLLTLSFTMALTLKWLSSLSIFTQESFRWRQCVALGIVSLFLQILRHRSPPVPLRRYLGLSTFNQPTN